MGFKRSYVKDRDDIGGFRAQPKLAPEPAPIENARWIPLTQGKFTLVDAWDYYWLNLWNWRYQDTGYVTRSAKTIRMHREIMQAPNGVDVDHIDGNPLNNTRANLRLATTSENCRNQRIRSNNKSGYKGVSWDKSRNKWRAYIVVNYKQTHLGYYDTPEEAAEAYKKAALELHGAYAKIL